ncbi:MAG TPA: rhodanese-like domain-containing protein [Casimicrobiaceae bacterium]|nr:rhodanese-like domain-containing protein [Casimicrobiaceae bacterium]
MDATGFYAAHELPIIFGTVLVQQLGVPLPAFPLLILAGANAFADPAHGLWVLILAVVASSLGNYAWFRAGMRYGYRVLNAVCRVSLSPDSCVRQTETAFERYGSATLVLARFLPGLGMVAPPLAGGLGFATSTFLLYNGLGSALWAAAGLVLGLMFHTQVEWLFAALAELGNRAIVALACLVVLYVAHRMWKRWRLRRALYAARISVTDLHDMMRRGEDVLVLDVRSRTHRKLDGRSIPGSKPIDLEDLERALAGIPRDRETVVYCACPNEASAAKVAMQLHARGVSHVRPLAGGIDAWATAGFEIDRGESLTLPQ